MTASPNKDRNATSPLRSGGYIFVFFFVIFFLVKYINMAASKNNDYRLY